VSDMMDTDFYFCKFDIKSGYFHVDIVNDHKKYLGFQWTHSNGESKYYFYEVLPFGLASACLIFTKIMRVFIKNWRALGVRVVIYIDDGIICAKLASKCQKIAQMMKKDLESAGFIINRKKSVWIPSQKGEFLGFDIDTTKMEFSVPPQKIEDLLILLRKALKDKLCDANFIARIAGKVISMGPALGPISRLMTRSLYTFIQSRFSWFEKEILCEDVLSELKFWETNISKASGFRMKGSAITTKVIFSDASDHGYGGFVMTRLGNIVAKGSFDEVECFESSTYRELIAVKYILQMVIC